MAAAENDLRIDGILSSLSTGRADGAQGWFCAGHVISDVETRCPCTAWKYRALITQPTDRDHPDAAHLAIHTYSGWLYLQFAPNLQWPSSMYKWQSGVPGRNGYPWELRVMSQSSGWLYLQDAPNLHQLNSI